MKLMELLEQGKKATREDIEKCLYVDVDRRDIEIFKICDNNKNEYNPSFKDLTRNDWSEYTEYKTNFEFKSGEKTYAIAHHGDLFESINKKDSFDCDMINNFNLFQNKELAEFIQKKQLLERKLIVFSYLNGASEINWHDDEVKHYINASIYEGKNEIEADYIAWYQSFNDIFFKDRKTCEKAIELYENEIKEVMKMKKKLGL